MKKCFSCARLCACDMTNAKRCKRFERSVLNLDQLGDILGKSGSCVLYRIKHKGERAVLKALNEAAGGKYLVILDHGKTGHRIWYKKYINKI